MSIICSYFGDTLSHDVGSPHLSGNVTAISANVDATGNRPLHQQHHHSLPQVPHQHLLDKGQVVPAISSAAYGTALSNIPLDSSYTYAHSQ